MYVNFSFKLWRPMTRILVHAPVLALLVIFGLFCVFIGVDTALPAGIETNKLHKIGVLAKEGKTATLKEWRATAEYLTDEIAGHRFEIVPLNFDEITVAVKEKEIEFILANPAIFLSLSAEDGVKPLATMETLHNGKNFSVFGGVIFVKANSRIRHFKELSKASFCAVSKDSLGGWLTARRELKRLHVVPAGNVEAVSFLGTHDDVVLAVLNGKYDAGTVRTGTLERMQREGKINLNDFRVLLQNEYYPTTAYPLLRSTSLYPEWPFAAAQFVPAQLNKEIVIALLKMPSEAKAARKASIVGWDVVHNYQSIHELEKDLRLGPYRNITYLNYNDVLENYNYQIKGGLFLFVVIMLLVGYLFRLKRLLRSDIQRRQKIEEALKTTNRRYYDEMMKYVHDGE